MPMPGWLQTMGATVQRLQEEAVPRAVIFQSAALAFFSLFSMAPVLLIAVMVAGVVFGEAAVQGQVIAHLEAWVGRDTASLVQAALVRARPSQTGLLPALVGLGVILFGATTVFVQLRYALNSIWHALPAYQGPRWRDSLRRRLLALIMVLLVGVVLVLSLVAGLILKFVYQFAGEWLIAPPSMLWFWVESSVSLLVLILAFAWVQKLATDVRLAGWTLWPGAVFSAILFALGRYLIAQYLTLVSMESAYGAAGTLVVGLAWLQYSAAVFLLGAVFNYACAGWREQTREADT